MWVGEVSGVVELVDVGAHLGGRSDETVGRIAAAAVVYGGVYGHSFRRWQRSVLVVAAAVVVMMVVW